MKRGSQTGGALSNVPNFEVFATVVSSHAEGERSVGTRSGYVNSSNLEIVLANKIGLARLNVPDLEVFVLRGCDETAWTLRAESQTGARFRVGIQLPQRFLIVAGVHVVDVTSFRAGQEAVGIEVIPKNAFNFTLEGPALEALATAIVDANNLVATARQQRLDLEGMELQALNFLRMGQRRSNHLIGHVP